LEIELGKNDLVAVPDGPLRLPECEDDFHFLWEHLHFDRDQLVTNDGHPVRVLHPGIHNQNQGPDFLDARIEIDGLEFHGHVELHIRSDEWYQHGHQSDQNYNNVILHVVLEHGKKPAKRQDGTDIPEVNLGTRIDQQILSNIHALRIQSGDFPCQAWLSDPAIQLPETMADQLGRERVRRKAALMQDRMDILTGDWEQVIWEEIARIMGGPVNGESFRHLARELPWKIVRKYVSPGRDDQYSAPGQVSGIRERTMMAAEKGAPYGKQFYESASPADAIRSSPSDGAGNEVFDRLALEALLFGMAGMLEEIPEQREPWPLRLRLEWAYLAQKHQLRPIRSRFMFHRMRPGAFPTIRLSQLAHLAHSFPDMASLLDPSHWSRFRSSTIEASRYWKNHLRFGEIRRKRPRKMGQNFKDLIVINTLAPLSMLYAGFHGQSDAVSEKAGGEKHLVPPGNTLILEALRSFPPEDNRILRRFKTCGEKPTNALQAQGLLELHKMYCVQSRCLECRFGQQIAAGKKSGGT
jgi:hypothetical protein